MTELAILAALVLAAIAVGVRMASYSREVTSMASLAGTPLPDDEAAS
jgi:hypothetical protein